MRAQTPANFSGKWQFDKSKSTPGQLKSTYDGTVVMSIIQEPSKISITEVWTGSDGNPFETAPDSFTLDGKEKVSKSDIGTQKQSARWSEDKKVLTVTSLSTQELKGKQEDFLETYSYKLSADGKTLSVESYSKNPVRGETKALALYQKK